MTAPPEQAPPRSASTPWDPRQKTLDLKAIAAVGKDEKVQVGRVKDLTLDAFDQTLRIIGHQGMGAVPEPVDESGLAARLKSAPQDSDLRKLYVFAEILGSYDAVNDLTRLHSPQQTLSTRYGETVLRRPLKPRERERLEEYHEQLKRAIENARDYYRNTGLEGLSLEDKHELYSLVLRARDKTREITEILGKNLMLEIERAIERLYEIRQAAMHVEPSVSGVFLVDNEVMFIPTEELIRLIDSIFKGVGNPYLAGHVDGVMLLAARNLLIEVVSFYSYYGKHQIYQLFRQGRTVDRKRMTLRIRHEIRNILAACKADNKLVLTRIMAKEEEQLDLSISAIEREAEKEAVNAVIRILPPAPAQAPSRRRRGWLRRMFRWLGL